MELIRGLVALAAPTLPEARGNLIKGPAFGLRHLEVGEDEEEHEQHCEDDEDVGAAELLGLKGNEEVSTWMEVMETWSC